MGSFTFSFGMPVKGFQYTGNSQLNNSSSCKPFFPSAGSWELSTTLVGELVGSVEAAGLPPQGIFWQGWRGTLDRL